MPVNFIQTLPFPTRNSRPANSSFCLKGSTQAEKSWPWEIPKHFSM
jgi:hypothetical protein